MQPETARTDEPKDSAAAEDGRGSGCDRPQADVDVEAILELQARILHLWSGLTAPARLSLAPHLELLTAAADRRETDSRMVRATLQEVLLTIGTGALATLSEASRRRLTALTGIVLSLSEA